MFLYEMAVYVSRAVRDVVDCFLVLGVELELQFLNHISLCKIIEQFGINDHDLFMLFVFHSICVKSKKKTSQTAAAFLRSQKVHI